MLFNSYIFILCFLPLCLTGYYILNKYGKYHLAQMFLLIMSIWFYGYFNVRYLAVIVCSIIVNYLIYLRLRNNHNKYIMILGVTVNLAILGFFKYMDFFIDNINRIFDADLRMLGIMLPLGISFFTFQQISFIIDAYKGEVPDYNLLYYASYVTFFPQLIAGPIVTQNELIPQFLDKQKKLIDWDNLAKGIYIFHLGLAKKVLIADVFGDAVNWGFSHIDLLDTTNAFLVMLGYTIQIYFDFSGYCDMAIGLAKMLNIDLPMNFNSPYKALSITEFWGRWHMTLTNFFTRYVYIPLGGNRKGNIRAYINVFIVFLLSGFWHGAAWGFVLWGVCHGMFMIITRIFKGFFEKLHPALSWLITFGFVNVMWVFFRADSVSEALKLLNRIAMFNFGGIRKEILECFKPVELSILLANTSVDLAYPNLALTVFYVSCLLIILGCKNAHEKMELFRPTFLKAATFAFLMAGCIFSLSGISTFLYFNF